MRIITAALITLLLSTTGSPQTAPTYDRSFTGDTMRVDYFHTGGPKAGETLALDRVVNDGPWSGSRTHLADTTDLGTYLFEVRDKASGALLYSRGFASLYGEWETTGEEKTLHRTFHESLRFPWPRQPVGVVLKYYTSDVADTTGVTAVKPEPWEPNVTALHNPARLKWQDLVTPGTPLPTPWDKAAFEQHSAAIQERRRDIRRRNAPEEDMDALFREQMEWDEKFLAATKYAGAVGAFEGAAYAARGLYRPEADCIMFTRDPVGFCRVCRRAITRIIDLYSS